MNNFWGDLSYISATTATLLVAFYTAAMASDVWLHYWRLDMASEILHDESLKVAAYGAQHIAMRSGFYDDVYTPRVLTATKAAIADIEMPTSKYYQNRELLQTFTSELLFRPDQYYPRLRGVSFSSLHCCRSLDHAMQEHLLQSQSITVLFMILLQSLLPQSCRKQHDAVHICVHYILGTY